MTPDSAALDRAKNELARILNVDGIKTGNPKWLALMREGVVVKLHVRRWRAKSRLDLNDLGLPSEADDLIGDLLNLGDKRLLPKALASRLEAIESAGRKALERNGYSTFWGTFVPASNFDAWKTENDTHKQRYLDARNELRDVLQRHRRPTDRRLPRRGPRGVPPRQSAGSRRGPAHDPAGSAATPARRRPVRQSVRPPHHPPDPDRKPDL